MGPLMKRILQSTGIESNQVPNDCVTMNSHVRLRYQSTGEVRDLHLAYPNGPSSRVSDVDQISVISPVGAALLGSRVGEVIQWNAPSGPQQGTVMEILYQPEFHGDPD
jgi:regulator of nucleoside diphosphate kinase